MAITKEESSQAWRGELSLLPAPPTGLPLPHPLPQNAVAGPCASYKLRMGFGTVQTQPASLGSHLHTLTAHAYCSPSKGVLATISLSLALLLWNSWREGHWGIGPQNSDSLHVPATKGELTEWVPPEASLLPVWHQKTWFFHFHFLYLEGELTIAHLTWLWNEQRHVIPKHFSNA